MEVERVGDLSVPGLGFGTHNRHGEVAFELVGAALAEGYRHIDTSRWYGNEEQVGRAIERSRIPREELWLTTKLLHPKSPPMPDLEAEMEESLRRLRTDYVDLLLVHWPRPDLDLENILSTFVALRERGQARAIGVSNFPTGLVEKALSLADGLLTDQVEYHALLDQDRLLAVLHEHGMFLTAYLPLARGKVLQEPLIAEIAASHGWSPAQVALRWVVQQHGVVAIPGAETVEQLKENLGALTIALDASEMTAISGLRRGVRVVDPAHGPGWDSA